MSRSIKDDFLISCKLAGMSYRDIQREGNFKVAESTLRGRYRTLTKEKEERVRKPKWNELDLKLLRESVEKYQRRAQEKVKGGRRGKRIPWMAVAEDIKNNGGSYHFGNATCRKRWDKLMMAEKEKLGERD